LTSFLLRKIKNNKWLMLCLILGNIILIATVSVVPLFVAATEQRLFQEDFYETQETRNIYPAQMHMRFNFNAAPQESMYADFIETRDIMLPEIISKMGVPVNFEIQSYIVTTIGMRPTIARELPIRTRSLQISAPQGFEDKINLLHGRMPSDSLVANDGPEGGYIIEALAINEVMFSYDLLLDELLEIDFAFNPDGSKLYVRITGIFEPDEKAGDFWSVAALHLRASLIVSNSIFTEQFINDQIDRIRLNSHWTTALDWQSMHVNRLSRYVQAVESSSELVFDSDGDNIREFSINFSDILKRGDASSPGSEASSIDTIIWVLQIPIFVMLALFMHMVTKQILTIDSNDISVLKSRGVSRRQILGIYSLQGLFVATISFPIGLVIGVALCSVIGTSSGFLELATRSTLDIRITGETILYGIIGAFVSFLYMLLPVIKLSKTGIVEYKRLKGEKNIKPLWERFYLDVLAFAVSVYMLYNFHIQRWIILSTFQEVRTFDPLMFFSSSLFIIGSALLLLRLYPYFMKLILLAGRRKIGPAIYASIIKISRSGGSEKLIMLFLVFTVAVGIFYAQSARTFNRNNEHRIRYLGGTDLIIQEEWQDNMLPPVLVNMGFSQPRFLMYKEPDFDRFQEFDEVTAITRVLEQKAVIQYGISTIPDATLMGIESNTFGETVWFRRGLTPIHINHFLNVLAENPNGVILSSNFRELGYSINNTVRIRATQVHGPDLSGDFRIVGFVDHWPSFSATEIKRLPTGEIVAEEQYLAVTNLGYLTSLIGIRPYQVWMRTDGASHQFIYDFIEESDIKVLDVYDNHKSLEKILLDPVIQSTNGFMSTGFIMTMLLCITGFLIYWILSIKERLLQFGVFRAMGMGMRGIIGILICEQGLITIVALALGGLVGEVTSRFFVVLLQFSYTAADQVIPLVIVRSPLDFVTIYSILGLMLVISIIILVRYTLRINVTQVLKLGED